LLCTHRLQHFNRSLSFLCYFFYMIHIYSLDTSLTSFRFFSILAPLREPTPSLCREPLPYKETRLG
jgi:hypothetical protein